MHTLRHVVVCFVTDFTIPRCIIVRCNVHVMLGYLKDRSNKISVQYSVSNIRLIYLTKSSVQMVDHRKKRQ